MKFRFRPGLLAATLVAFAILCSLGVWQLQRRAWKNDLIARAEQKLAATPIPFEDAARRAQAGENMEYQPVYLDGVYANDLEAGVFGTYQGAPGVYVFTPLDAADAATGERDFVYVNRGFAPQDHREPSTRGDGLVSGRTRVAGLFRNAERKRGFEHWLRPKDQPEDNLYFARDPRVLGAGRQIDAPPYYIDSFGDENPAEFPQGGLTRLEFPNRHLEYALTWFGLSAALVGVFIAYSLKRD